MTFCDKMSCRRARVKTKSGMVRLLIPCVYAPNFIQIVISQAKSILFTEKLIIYVFLQKVTFIFA